MSESNGNAVRNTCLSEPISLQSQLDDVRDDMYNLAMKGSKLGATVKKNAIAIFSVNDFVTFKNECDKHRITADLLIQHLRKYGIPSIIEIPEADQLEFLYNEAKSRGPKVMWKLGLALVKEIDDSDTSDG